MTYITFPESMIRISFDVHVAININAIYFKIVRSNVFNNAKNLFKKSIYYHHLQNSYENIKYHVGDCS